MLRVQIDGLHHQGVTIPPGDRITQPEFQFAGSVATVDGNNSGIVHHLHHDHDVVIGLHDLVHIIVKHIVHRRPTSAAEANQAALTQRPALGPIATPATAKTRPPQLQSLFGERNAAVFRISNPGCPHLASNHAKFGTRIDPKSVVTPATTQVLTVWQLSCHLVIIGGLPHVLMVIGGELLQPIRGNDQTDALVIIRPLHGGQGRIGPEAL